MKEPDFRPPKLTKEQIREALDRGAKDAREIEERLRRVFTPTPEQLARIYR